MYRVPVGLPTGGKNTRPVPVSIRVGYGCHPWVKNHHRTCTGRVGYPAGTYQILVPKLSSLEAGKMARTDKGLRGGSLLPS
jgi:hypothetical protein